MAAFSFKDHVVKIIRSSDNAELRLFSGNKGSVEPGPKATVMKGFDPRPFDIIYNSADPKWTLDGMSAPEVQQVIQFIGLLNGPLFSVSIVVQRPGQTTRHLRIVNGAVGEGGDWTFDEGSGATGKLGGPCKDILYALGTAPLKSIYAPRTR